MLIDKVYDCLIIGSGPAGMTAGIYLKRANKKIAIIEKNAPGGKIITTSEIENYPGYKNISGPDLAFEMFSQCQNLNIEFIFNEVVKLTKKDNIFEIELSNNTILKSLTVIISTGMINRNLNIKNEIRFQNKGISYCAICDGALFKQKDIVVIGSGRTAIEETIMLSELVNKIYLISNKKEFKADFIDVEKVKKIDNVEILMNYNTLEFEGDQKLEKVKIQEIDTKEIKYLDVEGAFIFIGFIPITPENNFNEIYSENKFIQVNEKLETKIKGLFAAGDIINKEYRQITTAVNDGTISALNVIKFLENK